MKLLKTSFPDISSGYQCDHTNYKKNAITLDVSAELIHLKSGRLTTKNYYLPPGHEGQLMYFSADASDNCDNICIWLDVHREFLCREVRKNGVWYPFRRERMLATAIFISGHWNLDSPTGP